MIDHLAHRGRDFRRGDAAQAIVMPFRTDALVTIAAWHIMRQHAMPHAPRRVLRVRERVQHHDWRTYRRRDVNRPRVVREQYRCERNHASQFIKCQSARKRPGWLSHQRSIRTWKC